MLYIRLLCSAEMAGASDPRGPIAAGIRQNGAKSAAKRIAPALTWKRASG